MASQTRQRMTTAELKGAARECADAIESPAQAYGRGSDYALGPEVLALLKSMARAFNYGLGKEMDIHDKYEEINADGFIDGSSRAIGALQRDFLEGTCTVELVVRAPIALDSPVRQLCKDFYKEVGATWADYALTEATARQVCQYLDERKMAWEVRVTW